ncbi:hypothetical protein [Novosphingobium sp. EMRT-2]|uniref:hypothetical protein n=1 Tax=Novosphingobium sp. EMRT-2 TaxID=2571749 RepID=UPI0010BE16AE|nr:hypothetical protein [Novosphingobium sp. EMRT-2]QCI92905.1 hypothetical protein FA702_04560 [Novosphingobium sp. EMRT-2]
MAKHLAREHFLPRTIYLGVMPTDREAIEQQIEALIEMLDHIDGDPDMEPDHEDYDACDAGEHIQLLPILPRYGEDQSEGPINEREAHDIYYAELCGSDE